MDSKDPVYASFTANDALSHDPVYAIKHMAHCRYLLNLYKDNGTEIGEMTFASPRFLSTQKPLF